MRRISLADSDVAVAAAELAEILRQPGAVAVVPTETVYGLIAKAGDEAALQRIFALKQRPVDKLVGWFVGDAGVLRDHGVILAGVPEKLIRQYTPGALTIIAPCCNGMTQGFRIPDHPLLAELLRLMKMPLVQTSANCSGMADAGSCDEALSQLTGEVDCAVDGGALPPGACGSTVVDATGNEPKILRQGAVDLKNWR